VINFNVQEHLGTLTIGNGGSVALKASPGVVHGVASFSIAGNTAPTGTLDVGKNSLAIDYAAGNSPFTNVKAQIVSGFNGGNWNGVGIRSSSASFSGAHPTAVGYAEASAVGLTSGLGGATTDASTVILRYTLAGDADLNQTVNSDDFTQLSNNFGSTSGIWSGGDFNYDGTVNALDFNLLASNYGAALPSEPTGLGALVPEPGAMVMVLATALLARRRASRR
jgi:hypothetical protein